MEKTNERRVAVSERANLVAREAILEVWWEGEGIFQIVADRNFRWRPILVFCFHGTDLGPAVTISLSPQPLSNVCLVSCLRCSRHRTAGVAALRTTKKLIPR